MPTETTVLLSISEAAQKLGISSKTLRRWEKAGLLTAIRTHGGHRRYPYNVLLELKRTKKHKRYHPTLNLVAPPPNLPTPLASRPAAGTNNSTPATPVTTPSIVSATPFEVKLSSGLRALKTFHAARQSKPTTPPATHHSLSNAPTHHRLPPSFSLPKFTVSGRTTAGLAAFFMFAFFISLATIAYSFAKPLVSRFWALPNSTDQVAATPKIPSPDSSNVLGSTTLPFPQLNVNVDTLFASAVQIDGPLSVNNDASVTGNLSLGQSLTFTSSGASLSSNESEYIISSGGIAVGGSNTLGISSVGNATLNNGTFAGTVSVTGATTVNGNLTASGSLINLGATTSTTTIAGNELSLNAGQTLKFTANADTDDYIYLSTSDNQPGFFFAGTSTTNDPGFRINTSSGKVEYRDENTSTWTTLDSLEDSVDVPAQLLTDGGTYLYPTNRESLRIFDSSGSDYIDITHDGSNVIVTTLNAANISFDNNLLLTGSATLTLPSSNALAGVANFAQFSQGISVGGGTTFNLSSAGNATFNNLNLQGDLTIADGQLVDLGAVLHDDATPQGLILPRSTALINPSVGEGYIAWDDINDRVVSYNGSSWTSIAGSSSTLQDAYVAGNTITLNATDGNLQISTDGGDQAFFIQETTGRVGIGDITPNALLTVGNGDAFQIDTSGNITAIGGLAHSVANSSGNLLVSSVGDLLLEDSTITSPLPLTVSDSDLNANLTRGVVDALNDLYDLTQLTGAQNYWSRTLGLVHPIIPSDSIAIGGTSTASASIYLDAPNGAATLSGTIAFGAAPSIADNNQVLTRSASNGLISSIDTSSWDKSTTNELQNLWATIQSQSGSTVANAQTDTLTINGAGIASTAISGDTLTITATEAQQLFNTIAVSGQNNVVADGLTDTLTFAAGSNITLTTNDTTDTVTVAVTGLDNYQYWTISDGTDTENVTTTSNVVFAGSTGITSDYDSGTNTLTITNSGVTQITGTSNQITASAGTGNVTLSLPQDIHTAANPTFAGINLGNINIAITDDNTIDTDSGNLVLDSAGGLIAVKDNALFEGSATISGTLALSNGLTVNQILDEDDLVSNSATALATQQSIKAYVDAQIGGTTYWSQIDNLIYPQEYWADALALGGNSTGSATIYAEGTTGTIRIADGGFLDLSSIIHNDSAPQGLRLPQADNLTNIAGGTEGYLAYDTGSNEVLVFNGTSWNNISGASTTLQQAYDLSTDPEITLNSTNDGVSILDNATPIGTSLLQVQNNARTESYLLVDTSGIYTLGSATVSGTLNVGNVATIADNNVVLTRSNGIISAIDTTSWDKSTTNELQNLWSQINGDSGNTTANTTTDTLTIAGGTNLTSAVSGDTLTVNLDNDISLSGTTGVTLTGAGSGVTFENGERIINSSADLLSFTDGSNTLAQLFDAGTIGNLFITGGISTFNTTVTDGYGEFSGLCLGDGTNCITDWGSAGVNYWSKSTEGVLFPSLSEPLAATSSATTVASFTSTGSNLAFQAGGATDFVTIDSSGNVSTTGNLTADNVLIRDTNQSHTLSFVWNENEATANRTLNLLLNGSDRTMSLSGNLTVEADSLINQDVTTDANPSFAGLTLTGLSADTDVRVVTVDSSTGVVSYIDSTNWDKSTADDVVDFTDLGDVPSTYTGAANQVVRVNSGETALEFVDPSTLGTNYWQLNGEQLSPNNALWHDVLVGGTSTGSATLALQANTGNLISTGTLTADSLFIRDTNQSHTLNFAWNENEATSNRVLNLLLNGGNRTLDLAADLQLSGGQNLTLTSNTQPNTVVFNEGFTIGDGSSGTLTFGAASKTLTVNDNAALNQDVQTTASPTFAGAALGNITVGILDDFTINTSSGNLWLAAASDTISLKDNALFEGSATISGTLALSNGLTVNQILDEDDLNSDSNTALATQQSIKAYVDAQIGGTNFFGNSNNLIYTLANRPLAATSSATTVASFTAGGSNLALQAGGTTNYLTVDQNGTLTIRNEQELRLADGDSSNYSGFKAPTNLSGNYIYTLPNGFGSGGQVLTTGGNGSLTWEDALTGSSVYFTLTGEQLHPKNALWHDLLVGGSSTASATIALQAETGNILSSGDLTLSGNDLAFGNGETIRNTTDGSLEFTDGSNVLGTLFDAGTIGNLYISGGISTFNTTVTDGYGEFSGLCLGDGTNCITDWSGAGVNYWSLSGTGILQPNASQPIAATSSATTVASFTSTGSNLAFQAGGTTNFATIDASGNIVTMGNLTADNLYLRDTAQDNTLGLISNEDLTGDRTLTLNLNNANRTLTLQANLSVTGASSINQDVQTSASPSFAGATLGNLSLGVVDDNTLTTSTGNLVIDSASGLIAVKDNILAEGAATVSGTLTLNSVGSSADTRLLNINSTTGLVSYVDSSSWDTNAANDVTTFLGLTDTPANYTGAANQVVRVNGAENALEFVNPALLGTNYWQLGSEGLAPGNTTLDVFIGGTATASSTIALQANTGVISLGTNNLRLDDNFLGISTDTDLLTLTNNLLSVAGDLKLQANGYLNFGTTSGSSGYGIRDLSGLVQFKNTGGSWFQVASESAIYDRAKYDRVVDATGLGTDLTIAGAITNASAGDTIFISPGSYSENIIISKSLTLIGAGINATTIAGAGTSGTITLNNGVNDVMISHLKVTNAGTTQHVLDGSSGSSRSRHHYDRLEVSGGLAGIYTNCTECRISNSYVHDTTGDGITFSISPDTQVVNNILKNNGGDGIEIGFSRPVVRGNSISNSTGRGIFASNADNALIEGNNINTTGNHGIHLDTSSSNNLVSNNVIQTAGNGAGEYGIHIYNTANYNTVSGNTIKNSYDDGINILSADYNAISDNTIQGSGQSGNTGNGIYVLEANFTIINSNAITTSSGYGIAILSNGSFNLNNSTITDNTLGSNTAGDIDYTPAGLSANNTFANNRTDGNFDVGSYDRTPVTGTTYTGDLLQLTLDGVDANSFTGNGLHFVVDQSQNTGNLLLAEDDGGTDLLAIDETGFISAYAGAIGIDNDANANNQLRTTIGSAAGADLFWGDDLVCDVSETNCGWATAAQAVNYWQLNAEQLSPANALWQDLMIGGTSTASATIGLQANTGRLFIADGGFLDLGNITHNDSAAQGLRLPQAASLTNIAGGTEGYLAYDTDSNEVLVFNGTTWTNISGASTTLQQAYNASTDPEITLDSTRDAVSILDNATPVGASLLQVQNNARTESYLLVDTSGIYTLGAATVSGTLNIGTVATIADNNVVLTRSNGIISEIDSSSWDKSTTNELQNLWSQINGDSGNTTANTTTDTLTIAGGTNLTSAVSGDTLTVNLDNDISLSGTTGVTLTGVGSAVIFQNGERIFNSTDGTLEFSDGTNTLAQLFDAGTVGNLFVSGGISTFNTTVTDGYGEFSGLCLGDGTSCITDWASAGVNYWSKSAEGVLYPSLSEPLAATSSATTVASFTAAGSNLAFQAGGVTDFATIDASGNVSTTGNVTADNVAVRDTNQSHTLSFTWNENEAAANRTLNLLLNGADRTVSLTGNLTVEAASLINQDLTTDASPTFAGLTLTGLSADTDVRVVTVDSSTGVVSYIDSTNWDKSTADDVTTFLGLSDTPANYTGAANQVVRVNGAENALEFVDPATLGTNYWQLNSGVLSPFSLTADILLGSTASASAKIDLAGSLTRGRAVAIFNQTEAQDILSASASGVTQMTLSQTGDLTLQGNLTADNLYLRDTATNNTLGLISNENLTGDRTLTLNLNDADRTLTLQGNLTVEALSVINQDLTTDASPGFANLTLTGTLSVDGNTIGLNDDADADNLLGVTAAAGGAGSDLFWGDDLLCDVSEANCGWLTAGGATQYWQLNGEQLAPGNALWHDILVGGTATSSSTIALQANTGVLSFGTNNLRLDDNLIGISTDTDLLTLTNNLLSVAGDLKLQANGYLNFGTTSGSSGYGLRDLSGLVQFKNSGGSWFQVASESAVYDRAKYDRVVDATGLGTDLTIQGAITNASAGDSIFISPGTYTENVTIDKSITLEGAGRNAVTITRSTGGATVTVSSGVNDVRIAHLKIVNSGTASTDFGINVPEGTQRNRHTYDDIEIQGGGTGFYIDDVDNAYITNSYIHDSDDFFLNADEDDDLTITNNTFKTSALDGVQLGNGSRTLFTNNVIHTVNRDAFIPNNSYSTISNNTIENVTIGHGIYIGGVTNVVIDGNVLRNIGSGGGDYAINIFGTDYLTVSNNSIIDAADHGIALQNGVDNLILSGNSIYSSGGDGINSGTTTTSTAITGNTISGNVGQGIDVGGATISNSIIANNTLVTNTGGDLTYTETNSNNTVGPNMSDSTSTDVTRIARYPATGTTYSGDLLQLTLDGVDANSFTGNGLHFVVDQSQNTGNLVLAEDDGGADLFALDESGNITMAGDLTVSGGDITGIGGAAIDLGDLAGSGNLSLLANDVDDYIYLNTASNLAGLFWEGEAATNDPGLRVSSGKLQYRDDDSATWVNLDDLEDAAATTYWALTGEQLHPNNALWHDVLVGGTSTAAATIALQAETGNITSLGNVTADNLLIRDTNQSHTLSFVWNENEASTNRTLNLLLNGGNRSLSLSGDLTVEAASIINQDVTTDANVTFGSLALTSTLSVDGNTIGLNDDADADNLLGIAAAAGEAGSDLYWGNDLICDVSETNCGWLTSGTATQYWQLNNGALSPFSLTADLLLGSTASSSAKIDLAGSLTRGRAVAIFNQTEAQDILAASASGVTRMYLTNAGQLALTTTGSTGGLSLGDDTNLYDDGSNILRTGDNLTVDLDLTVSGGDITGANSASIDIGELTSGNISLLPNGDADDYFYLTTASNLPQLMFETGMSSNDAGFRISASDDTGQLQYRDQNSGTWVNFDDFLLAANNLDLWQLGTQGLAAGNTTLDLYVGGTATASSKFHAAALETAAGGLIDITSTGITTGSVFDLTASALTSGTLLNATSTSTALTSGRLGYFNWEPATPATASGDLFVLNIGAHGDISGNLLNITSAGQSLFSVSETGVTSNLPTSFTSAGDVSMANDLNFTNATAAYINFTDGPGYIRTTHPSGNNHLTLSAANLGDVYIADSLVAEGTRAGRAGFVFNETGGNDILTASASGSTRLTLNNAGQLTLPVTGSTGGLVLGDDTNLYDGGSNILRTGDNLTVDLDLTVSGGDIIGIGGATIDLGEITSGNIALLANDTDDYIYFNTASDIATLFWEGASGTNDPGIRVNGSGQLEYRDEDSASWITIDSLEDAASPNFWQVNSGALSPGNLTYDLLLGSTASSSAKIDLAGSLTRGRAVAIFNQTESEDIFAASASGTTRLYLTNAGQLVLPTTGSTGGLVLGDDTNLYDDGSNILRTGDNLTVDLDLTVSGNDLTFGNGEVIHNQADGTLNFTDGTNSLAQFFDAGSVGNLYITGGISTFDTTVTDGYVEASGLCLANGSDCITSWAGAGVNYWTQSGTGILSPNSNQPIAATSSATTVASFTSTGSNLAFQAGGTTTYVTIDQNGNLNSLGNVTADNLYLRDTAADNTLGLISNENLTGDRALTLNLNDADRTLSLQGNLTVEAASLINQDVTTDASVTFANLSLTGTLSVDGNTIGLNDDADADNLLGVSAAAGAAGSSLYWGDDLLCDPTLSNCGWLAAASNQDYWQLGTQGLAAGNTTLDLFVGGTATASSKFHAAALETTTGGLIDILSSTITTGSVFDLTASALTSGTLLNATSTSTALTSGRLGYFNWEPSTPATASGDLFVLNIGAHGDISGNLLNITSAGSSLFSVSETGITANLPTSFTSAGDVSMANDLNFTNASAAYVSFNSAPGYIRTYNPSGNYDLTLSAANMGDVVVADSFVVEGAQVGRAMAVLNQTGTQDILTASASGSTRLTLSNAGQLSLPVTGSTGGLVLGDDTQLYDGGANILRTPDNLTVDLDLTVTGNTLTFGSGEVLSLDTDGTFDFTDGTNSLAQIFDAGTVGNLFITGGISTFDTTVTDGYVEASGLCLDNGTDCITDWTQAGIGADGSSNWQINAGVLSPGNLTLDVLLGSTATTSAKIDLAGSNVRGRAVAIFNQTEAQDIFSASASGSTRFVIGNNGQLGINSLTTSDYLVNINADSTNDFSRALSIAQANNVVENTTGIYINSTPNKGSTAVGANDYSIESNIEPTATLTDGADHNTYGVYSYAGLSGLTLSDTSSGSYNRIYATTFEGTLQGNPTINNTGTNPSRVYANGATIGSSVTPVLTNVVAGSLFDSIGGDFYNTSWTAGNANLTSTAYGIRAATSGDLTTTGATTHYGGHFTAGGGADTNYGIYVTSSGATTNYGLYSAAGTNYFGANVGIGDTGPDAFLDIAGTTEQLRLAYENTDTNYASFTVGSSGDLTIDTTGNNVVIGNTDTLDVYSGILGLDTDGNANNQLRTTAGSAAAADLFWGDDLICDVSETNCGWATTAQASNYWQLGTGGLAPGNTTLDLFVGGTATASAKVHAAALELTSGGLFDVISSAITTGSVFDLTSSALTTGTLLNATSTSNALTTGKLGYFNWEPSAPATASGDLFVLNIGAHGDITGNLLNITSAGSSLFSVSETAVTSNLPTNFTAAGDVGFAYDVQFTNQTASYLKSYAPLYIQTGEAFESNNLTLQTYNSGKVLVDATALGGLGVSSNVSGNTFNGLFTVAGTRTGHALVQLNETGGTQNILTASASGTTRLNLTNGGLLQLLAEGASTTGLEIGTGGDININTDGISSTIDNDTGTLTVSTSDNLLLVADNDTLDHLYLDTTADLPALFWETGMTTNDAGIRLSASDDTGQLQYRDQNSGTWVNFDDLMTTASNQDYWQLGTQGVAPGNTTHDLYVGGTATASAKVHASALERVDGGLLDVISSAITTGSVFDLTSSALTSGTLFNATSTSTALTTGRLGYFNWEPSAPATASGDLFVLNIGAHGDISGNLLNITSAGSSIFSVSETGITSSVPHSFTAAGDVSVAYDIVLTNQTASYIKSNAPLTIEAGESFENNNLTLKTYGTGDLIFDNDGATKIIFNDEGDIGIGDTTAITSANVPNGSLVVDNGIICVDNTGTNCDDASRTAGTIYSVGTAVTGIDVAENYPTNDSLLPGDVVVADTTSPVYVKKSSGQYEANVLGIVSTQPGVTLGGFATPSATMVPVALTGRVPVKVSTQNGAIQIGDPLTTSNIPGVAMKATKTGRIIGRALESYTNTDANLVGTVTSFVETTWYDPQMVLTADGNLNLPGNANIGGDLTVQGRNILNELNTLNSSATSLNNSVTSLTSSIAAINNQLTNQPSNPFTAQTLGIGVTAPASGSGKLIDTNSGAYLSQSGIWTNVSDVNKKENFRDIDEDAILDGIRNLPVTRWNYKSQSGAITHIGPTAQDFHRIFNVGENNTTISTLDPSGVALVGIKALDNKLNSVSSELAAYQATANAAITAMSTVLEQDAQENTQVDSLTTRINTLESKLADQSQSIATIAATTNVLGTTSLFNEANATGSASLDLSLDAELVASETASLKDSIDLVRHQVLDLRDDLNLLLSDFVNPAASESATASSSAYLFEDQLNTFSSSTTGQVFADSIIATDLTLTGRLTAGMLEVDGFEGAISTLVGPLQLQTSPLAGNIEAFDKQIVMTPSGDITVTGTLTAQTVKATQVQAASAVLGKLTIATTSAELEKLTITASDSATIASASTSAALANSQPAAPSIGSAVLPAYQTILYVENQSVSANSSIFITPTTLTDKPLSVIQIDPGVGFAIGTKAVSNTPVTFNWWIVN